MSCVQLFAVPAVPVPDERSWQSHAVVDLAYRVSGDSPDARGMIGARCRTGRLRSSRPSGYAANAQSGTAAHTTGRRSASRAARSSRSTAPRPTRCRTCDRADSAPAASDAVASREARCRHRSQLAHHPGAFPFAACTWLVLKRRARLNAAEAHATGDGQGTAARAERLLLCKPSPLRQATASGISEAARPPCKRRGIRARGSLLDSPPTCSATISTVGDPDRAPRPAPTSYGGPAGDRPCVPGPRRSSFHAGGADPVRGAGRAQISRVRRSGLEGVG